MTLTFSIIALLFCAFLYAAAKFIISFRRSHNLKRINLLAKIDQKLFMTAWLGSFFAGLFLMLPYLASLVLEKNFYLGAFAYGKGNPGTFFYLGGVLFAATTLLVYLVRIAGKRVYGRMEKSRKK